MTARAETAPRRASGEAETLDSVLRRIRARFSAGGIADGALEARLLVGGLLDIDAARIIAHGRGHVDAGALQRIDEAVERRLAGEPIHRILGSRAFFGLDLRLSPATLEPRPDTEILVAAVLARFAERGGTDRSFRLADMGTGTGAIALAVLVHCPAATAVGVDISAPALATARANSKSVGVAGRFSTLESNWFDALEGRFDAIVSNPPYIPSAEIGGLMREVRDHDPALALDGGDDGLDAYRVLAAGARGHLRDDGFIAVEHGATQRDDVEAVFAKAGFTALAHHDDLGGRNRAIVFGV